MAVAAPWRGRDCLRMRGGVGRDRYNFLFLHLTPGIHMDAERINQIANSLADLRQREQQLRGYL